MSNEIAIRAEHLSKKFARSLKRAMIYGLRDIGRAALPGHRGVFRAGIPDRFGSKHLDARISDAEREPFNELNESPSSPVKESTTQQPDNSAASSPRINKSTNDPIDQNSDGLRPSEFWALRDVTFTVKKGERLGIIGPNGAGKSTLFSVLSGIYGPSEGRVEVRGRLQALIALGAGFHPTLSGRENIYINAAILGFDGKWVSRKMEEIIDFADIGEFIDAPVKNYSSGMLVRLGFAIAANMDPDIMLIDEVLAVGDARFQSKCIGFSKKLGEQGHTVVMVSHSLSQILRVCERAIWIDRGRIVMDGDASNVVRSYSTWSLQGIGRSRETESDSKEVVGTSVNFSYRTAPEECEDTPQELLDDKTQLPVIIRGTTLRLIIKYELLAPINGKLNFWAHVKDALSDVRIFGAGAASKDALIEAEPGQKGTVVFEFPHIPLLEGIYNWDVGVSDFGECGETGSLAKVLESTASFIVASSRKDFREPITGTAERLPLIDYPCRIIPFAK